MINLLESCRYFTHVQHRRSDTSKKQMDVVHMLQPPACLSMASTALSGTEEFDTCRVPVLLGYTQKCEVFRETHHRNRTAEVLKVTSSSSRTSTKMSSGTTSMPAPISSELQNGHEIQMWQELFGFRCFPLMIPCEIYASLNFSRENYLRNLSVFC